MQYFTKLCTVGLVLMLGLSSLAKGQGYESIFGDNSTSWKQIRYVFGNQTVDSLFIKNDTLINGKLYNEIRHCIDCDVSPPYFFLAFIREDTIEGKIWLRRGGQEALVMDMSLTQSDSFFVDSLYAQNYGWKQVDSVYHQKNKKYILLEGAFHKKHRLEFIEGIGPSLGYSNMTIPPYDYWLSCSYKNSSVKYFNQRDTSERLLYDTIFQSCPSNRFTLGNSTDYVQQKPNIQIYPNPAQRVIILEIRYPNRVNYLKLYNTSGQLIKSKQLSNGRVQINKPGQGNIYFYLLLNEKGEPLKRGKMLFTE